MGKKYKNPLDEYKILVCMWNYVLLHQMDKILKVQKLTFVLNVQCDLQLIE